MLDKNIELILDSTPGEDNFYNTNLVLFNKAEKNFIVDFIENRNLNLIDNPKATDNLTNNIDNSDDNINVKTYLTDNLHKKSYIKDNMSTILPPGSIVNVDLIPKVYFKKNNLGDSIKNFFNKKKLEGYILKKTRKLEKASIVVLEDRMFNIKFINTIANTNEIIYKNINISKLYSHLTGNQINNQWAPLQFSAQITIINQFIAEEYGVSIKPSDIISNHNILIEIKKENDNSNNNNNDIQLSTSEKPFTTLLKGYPIYSNEIISEYLELYKYDKLSSLYTKYLPVSVFKIITDDKKLKMSFNEYSYLRNLIKSSSGNNNTLFNTMISRYDNASNSNSELEYYREKLINFDKKLPVIYTYVDVANSINIDDLAGLLGTLYKIISEGNITNVNVLQDYKQVYNQYINAIIYNNTWNINNSNIPDDMISLNVSSNITFNYNDSNTIDSSKLIYGKENSSNNNKTIDDTELTYNS